MSINSREPSRSWQLEAVRSMHLELWKYPTFYTEAWWMDYTRALGIRVHPTIDEPIPADFPMPPTFALRSPGTEIATVTAPGWDGLGPSGNIFAYSRSNVWSDGLYYGQHFDDVPGTNALTSLFMDTGETVWPRGGNPLDFWTGFESDNGYGLPSSGRYGQWSGWLFEPRLLVGDIYSPSDGNPLANIMEWGQQMMVRRGRLRLSRPRLGWLATAEIWACTSGATIGWDDYQLGDTNLDATVWSYCLALPGNAGPVATYLRPWKLAAFAGPPFQSLNTLGFGHDIPMPDSSIVGRSIADGFLGRITFLVWGETPGAWQARTGVTLIGAP
jgi:hypothetical protein